jgi:hypothetical protein
MIKNKTVSEEAECASFFIDRCSYPEVVALLGTLRFLTAELTPT